MKTTIDILEGNTFATSDERGDMEGARRSPTASTPTTRAFCRAGV
jgi:hypothetical protein